MCNKLHYIKKIKVYAMTRAFNNNNRGAVHLSKTWSCFGAILFCFPKSHSMAKTQQPVIPALHFGPVFHALLYIKGTNYSRGHCRDWKKDQCMYSPKSVQPLNQSRKLPKANKGFLFSPKNAHNFPVFPLYLLA